MRKNIIKGFCLSLLLIGVSAFAKVQHLSLVLTSIKVHQTAEKRGDEIYLDFVAYLAGKKPNFFRLPKAPHHWPSFALNRLKDVPLLQFDLKPEENLSLAISLVEKDAKPWNSDDLLGVMRLRVVNVHEGLLVGMNKVNEESARMSLLKKSAKDFTVTVKNGTAHYDLSFRLSKLAKQKVKLHKKP